MQHDLNSVEISKLYWESLYEQQKQTPYYILIWGNQGSSQNKEECPRFMAKSDIPLLFSKPGTVESKQPHSPT